MILSTQTDALSMRYGDIKAIEMLAKAGFDALDYSMFPLRTEQDHPVLSPNHEKYALELKKVASDNGVFFNPFCGIGKLFLEEYARVKEKTAVLRFCPRRCHSVYL